jgi:ABC-type transporter Mla maintaining outer membrane lipid asymmetry permease subunit MlaE
MVATDRLGRVTGWVGASGTNVRYTRELIRQMDAVGSKSLPLVALAGAAAGVVLSLQTRDTLARFGAKSMLPAVIRSYRGRRAHQCAPCL